MPEPMRRLIRRENLLPRDSRVLCAVSGGADSVCLLAGLYALREELGITLAVAHYNHNLRGAESRRDEIFVRDLIRDRFPGVKLYIGGGDVASEAKAKRKGVEETARAMRYAFLRETARLCGADFIATAHTADDNAETILLHLGRGSGLQGLGGMPFLRNGIVRPLLTTTRSEVEEFLRNKGLPHVEDSSNADDRYARNRVRHQVIPVLEALYPGFAARISENARRVREDEEYLSAQAHILFRTAESSGAGLRISAQLLAEAPKPIAARAVRRMLTELQGGEDCCAAVHLEQILRLCGLDDPSAKLNLPGGLEARREYEVLHLLRPVACPSLEPTPLNTNGETRAGRWRLTCTPVVYAGEEQGVRAFYLCAPNDDVSVRARREGDLLRLPGRPRKTVKKWLIEQKIPRYLRDDLPVLTCGDEVAAVAELGMDQRFLPQKGERALAIRLIPEEEDKE